MESLPQPLPHQQKNECNKHHHHTFRGTISKYLHELKQKMKYVHNNLLEKKKHKVIFSKDFDIFDIEIIYVS